MWVESQQAATMQTAVVIFLESMHASVTRSMTMSEPMEVNGMSYMLMLYLAEINSIQPCHNTLSTATKAPNFCCPPQSGLLLLTSPCSQWPGVEKETRNDDSLLQLFTILLYFSPSDLTEPHRISHCQWELCKNWLHIQNRSKGFKRFCKTIVLLQQV